MCTSYQVPPTEHPLEVLCMDLLENPARHNHNRQPSTYVVEAHQRRYHHT
jgi:hypothetical protein